MRKLSFSARIADWLVVACVLMLIFCCSLMWLIEAGRPYP